MTQLDSLGTLETTEVSARTYVVSARGQIDGRLASELRDALVPIAAADDTRVALNLCDAHGLDDDALSVVSQAAHMTAGRGDRLVLVTPSQTLLERIHESGLGDIVTIRASLEDVWND